MVPRVVGVVPRVVGLVPRGLRVVPRVVGVVPRGLRVALWFCFQGLYLSAYAESLSAWTKKTKQESGVTHRPLTLDRWGLEPLAAGG